MKKVLVLLVLGAVLSGVAAYTAGVAAGPAQEQT
jgi:TRAP-type mannitol/chloroaromatic compound transport system permease large subunit